MQLVDQGQQKDGRKSLLISKTRNRQHKSIVNSEMKNILNKIFGESIVQQNSKKREFIINQTLNFSLVSFQLSSTLNIFGEVLIINPLQNNLFHEIQTLVLFEVWSLGETWLSSTLSLRGSSIWPAKAAASFSFCNLLLLFSIPTITPTMTQLSSILRRTPMGIVVESMIMVFFDIDYPPDSEG